jgi:hypothetical protein
MRWPARRFESRRVSTRSSPARASHACLLPPPAPVSAHGCRRRFPRHIALEAMAGCAPAPLQQLLHHHLHLLHHHLIVCAAQPNCSAMSCRHGQPAGTYSCSLAQALANPSASSCQPSSPPPPLSSSLCRPSYHSCAINAPTCSAGGVAKLLC